MPKNVYEMVPLSLAELEVKVAPCGVIGDNPAVGLLLYEHCFEFDWVPAPYITAEHTYVHTGLNRPIRVYKNIDSRLIIDDLFAKLELFHKNTFGVIKSI